MRKRTLWRRSVGALLALVMVLGTVNLAALGAGEAEDPDQEIVRTEDREDLKGQEGSENSEALEGSEGLKGSDGLEDPKDQEGQNDQEGREDQRDQGSSKMRGPAESKAALRSAPATYQVIFDANGGDGAPPEPLTVPDWTVGLDSVGMSLPGQGSMTKEGFKFAGWATSAGGKTPAAPKDIWIFGSDVTLYAIWEEEGEESYTVTLEYDLNGLTNAAMPGHPAQRVNAGETASWTVKGCYVTPPKGKEFAGWNTRADGTGETYQADAVISVTPTEDTDVILYAQWKEIVNTLTVRFEPNGGAGTMEALVIDANENNMAIYRLPDCGFTPPIGKKFDCWGSSNPSATYTWEPGTTQYTPLSGGSTTQTYVAKWVDDPAFVCTCTEKCGENGNSECVVCRDHRELCASNITMVELHIYTHFTMRDQYVYLKDHVSESELGKVEKLFEDNQPGKESIVDAHSLTYSYTVNGEKKEVTLNGSTEGVEKVDFDQNYTYDGEGNLVESGRHNDAAWHWTVRIPVADGTRGTNIDFTQTGYGALTDRDNLNYVNTWSTGYMSSGAPHLSAGTKDGSGNLSVYASDAEGSVHLHVYNNFEVPGVKEQSVGYMWTGNPENWDDSKPEGGWYLPGTTVGVDTEFQEGTEKVASNGKTYVFSGWAGQYTSGGDDVYGTPVTVENDRITITNSVRFEGRWTEKTYTVTYTDGVEGQEVFADQVNGGLKKGEATPAFRGTPSRDGYTFLGWTPTVVDTVAADATYAAQWRANNGGGGGDSTTYTLTVRYVYEDGSEAAAAFGPRSYAGGYRYSVASPAIEGYTADILTAEGTLTRNTVITVTYTANEEEPEEPDTPLTEEPDETPAPSGSPEPDEGPAEELPPEEETPLSELPEEPLPETPVETLEEDLIDEETPLADVPQTGDGLGRALWSAMTLVSAAGLVVLARTGRRKEEQEG